jgi:hypothetical protein
MKWSLVMKEGMTQINLTPENDHEREVAKILRESAGPATIHHGVSVDLCQGGYLRQWEGDHDKVIAITIRKASA